MLLFKLLVAVTFHAKVHSVIVAPRLERQLLAIYTADVARPVVLCLGHSAGRDGEPPAPRTSPRAKLNT